MEWYYLQGKDKVGPILGQQFAALARQGKIGPDTPVWRKGLTSWQPAREAAGALFGGTAAASTMAQAAMGGLDDSVSGMGSAALGMDTEFACCSCGKTYSKGHLRKFEEHDVCTACHAQFLERRERGHPIFYDEYMKLARKRQRIRVARWVFGAVVCLIGVAAVFLWKADHVGAAKVARVAASVGLLAVAVSGGAHKNRYGLCMLGALAVCLVSDLVMGLPEGKLTPVALGVFALAHIALIVAFCLRGIALAWLIVIGGIFVLVIGGVLSWLYPQAPEGSQIPLVAYVILMSAVPIVGGSTRGAGASLFIPFGALSIYLFDVFIGRMCYVAPGFVNAAIGLPLYYVGLALLALSIPEERKEPAVQVVEEAPR